MSRGNQWLQNLKQCWTVGQTGELKNLEHELQLNLFIAILNDINVVGCHL